MMMGGADHLAAMSREHASEQDPLKAEITALRAQLEEATAALREIVEAKMPGEARSIARFALEAINKGGK